MRSPQYQDTNARISYVYNPYSFIISTSRIKSSYDPSFQSLFSIPAPSTIITIITITTITITIITIWSKS